MNATNPTIRKAWNFFRSNAGYSTPPGLAKCALDLARAEQAAKVQGWYVTDEPDPESSPADWGETEGYCFVVDLRNEAGEIIASIGAVHSLSDYGVDSDYLRVLRAELASELL